MALSVRYTDDAARGSMSSEAATAAVFVASAAGL